MFSMRNTAFAISNGTEARAPAPAVGRAIQVLDVVAQAAVPPGVSEISRQTGLSKSSTHALLSALTDERMLEVVDGGYRLGTRLVALGTRARDQRVHNAAQVELQRLAAETGETVFFGRVEGERVHVLARAESTRSLSLSAPVGSTVPVLAGALGRAYLSSLGEGAAQAFLASHPPHRDTERSIVDIDAYIREVRATARRGFAVEREEYLLGVAAAAAALTWSGTSYLVWAVGIDATFDDGALEGLGHSVRVAAERVAGRLNYDGQDSAKGGS